ncbi:PID-CTERM protein-sorting domain-containing protein [Hymenobacter sp.]|uniref:PID-CTERM protein-sorting domain-containing protein n=1 Tax=Hymenobacter sp. TaxID=1898978 RepID=UPI0039C8766D
MKYFLSLTALIFSTLLAHAQSPTTGGPTPPGPSPAAVPLDGGTTLLLAGGVAYGLRRLRARKIR